MSIRPILPLLVSKDVSPGAGGGGVGDAVIVFSGSATVVDIPLEAGFYVVKANWGSTNECEIFIPPSLILTGLIENCGPTVDFGTFYSIGTTTIQETGGILRFRAHQIFHFQAAAAQKQVRSISQILKLG